MKREYFKTWYVRTMRQDDYVAVRIIALTLVCDAA
jgi:hypothetical protein